MRRGGDPTEPLPWASGDSGMEPALFKEPLPKSSVEFVGRPVADQDAVELMSIGVGADRAAEVRACRVEAGVADEAHAVGGVIAVAAERVREGADGPAQQVFERALAAGDLAALVVGRQRRKTRMVDGVRADVDQA